MGRALVVEDDQAICELISDTLALAGFEAHCVQTDRDAYAALAERPAIDALVLDINLGRGTTGYDIARFARQSMPGLAVIYVSGEASETSFSAFGVPDSVFVAKPFNTDDLLAALQSKLAAAD